MPANFESGATFGERSWHGEENNLPANDDRRFSVDGTIDASDMDWTVKKLPLAVSSTQGELGGIEAPGCFAMYRTDTWDCLGGVGRDYTELQNRDIFARFQPYLDARQLAFESAGSLDKGRRVYVQARLCQDDTDLGGGDTVRPMLLIASSHDGSLATRVGFTPIRVVCDNTLSAAVTNGRKQLLTIRHTKSQKETLDQVMKTIDYARGEFDKTCEAYRRLMRKPLNRDQLTKYAKVILKIDDGEKLSSQKRNQLDRIIQSAIYGRGQSAGELTAWSAYNGVTEWTSHYRQSSGEARRKSVWFGASEADNRRALEIALQLAS